MSIDFLNFSFFLLFFVFVRVGLGLKKKMIQEEETVHLFYSV
jgi:hypothetical protein